MSKKTKNISINVLSVFIILVCLLFAVVGETNAWFTAEHQNGIQIVVDVGVLKLKVYQNSIDDNNQIYTNEDNVKESTSKYVNLGGEVLPDTVVPLTLLLSNQDKGSASMYVRFKFEIFARGRDATDDRLVASTISGFTPATYVSAGNAGNQKGFRYNSADGYYYYQSAEGASVANFSSTYNAKMVKNEYATLLTGFTIPYEGYTTASGEFIPGFLDEEGNFINGSESIYIKLTVEAGINSTF